MSGPSHQRLTGISGCLVALLIGIVTIALVRISLWRLTGEVPDLQAKWAAWLFWAVLVAAPFSYLALKGVGANVPWITAAILTAAYWGVFLALPLVRPHDRNDLGAILLMLLYPVFIIASALAADRAARPHR